MKYFENSTGVKPCKVWGWICCNKPPPTVQNYTFGNLLSSNMKSDDLTFYWCFSQARECDAPRWALFATLAQDLALFWGWRPAIPSWFEVRARGFSWKRKKTQVSQLLHHHFFWFARARTRPAALPAWPRARARYSLHNSCWLIKLSIALLFRHFQAWISCQRPAHLFDQYFKTPPRFEITIFLSNKSRLDSTSLKKIYLIAIFRRFFLKKKRLLLHFNGTYCTNNFQAY